MTIPTIQHLLSVAEGLEATPLDLLKALSPVWEAMNRAGKSWRLGYKTEDGIEWLRQPKRPPGYVGGPPLPGLPYDFANPKVAIEWRDACIAKLERHLSRKAA